MRIARATGSRDLGERRAFVAAVEAAVGAWAEQQPADQRAAGRSIGAQRDAQGKPGIVAIAVERAGHDRRACGRRARCRFRPSVAPWTAAGANASIVGAATPPSVRARAGGDAREHVVEQLGEGCGLAAVADRERQIVAHVVERVLKARRRPFRAAGDARGEMTSVANAAATRPGSSPASRPRPCSISSLITSALPAKIAPSSTAGRSERRRSAVSPRRRRQSR